MVQLLEQINAQVAELFTIDVMSKKENNTDSSSGLEDSDDSNIYFAPEQSQKAIVCSNCVGKSMVCL